MCQLCGVYLHFNPAKGKHAGKNCFHDYHDTCLFELVQSYNHIGKIQKKGMGISFSFKGKGKYEEVVFSISRCVVI